jgi:hypothetical protein
MTAPARWRITIFREPQPKPFDHKFQLVGDCGCCFVARSIDAACRLVDVLEFHAAHPELTAPAGYVDLHVRQMCS